jgi:predicted Rdx family selenoprotein
MEDWVILMGVGGLFILLGVGAIIWDRAESKGYYNAIATRHDVREYLQHDPERPEFGALKKGGWTAIIVGFALIALGLFWLVR